MFHNKTPYFTDFIEKQVEFPLFLDAPDNTSCHYFTKIQSRFEQHLRIINL
ncbi:hypothetical protein Hanom_Chr15g01413611 [Helianthus anomalus]